MSKIRLLAAGFLIVYPLTVHLYCLMAIPDPIFQLDSFSYLQPALDLLFKHQFNLPVSRTPGYPLFLFTLLWTTKRFSYILFAQHALAIFSGAITAILYYRFFNTSVLSSATLFALTTSLPKAVLASHTILTETSYTSILLLSLLLFFEALHHPKQRYWILSAMGGAIAVLIRPVGWSLLFALLLTGGWWATRKKHAPQVLLFMLVSSLLLGGWSSYNFLRRGFFGIDQFAGISLFGSTARFLDPQMLTDPTLKAVLVPVYNQAQQKFLDQAWVRTNPDGPVSALAERYPDPGRLNQVLKTLSWISIFQQPYSFTRDQVRRFWYFLSTRTATPDIYLDREYTFFVYRGILLYAKFCSPYPGALSWISHRPEIALDRLHQLHDVLTMTPPQAENRLEEISESDIYPYAKLLWFWKPMTPIILGMSWLPLLALMGSVVLLLKPAYRFQTATLCVLIVFHIILTNLGGDDDPRHAIPLEPVYWLLAWGGLTRVYKSLQSIV